MLLESFEKGVLNSNLHPAMFSEMNRLLMESVISNKETVLCDMPEVLSRWQIANKYSIDEFVDIFNTIMSKIDQR
jgi:hypothetical protein